MNSPATTVQFRAGVSSHFRCDSRARTFSDKIGHSECVILRDPCKLPDLHSALTRSRAHVCDGIAQSREDFKVGSPP